MAKFSNCEVSCCAALCNYYGKHRKYFKSFSPKNRVKKKLLFSGFFKYGAEKSGTTILFFSGTLVAKTAERSVVSCCPQEAVSTYGSFHGRFTTQKFFHMKHFFKYFISNLNRSVFFYFAVI